ncbi:hypothetical protein ACS0TY_014106 [Phlomoides rotata]
MRERLPTTSKLHRYNILPVGADVQCVFCRNAEETVRHVFFECSFAYNIWMGCFRWLGVETALPSIPMMNFLLFCGLLNWKRGKVIAGCIWACVVWTIWKGRNALIFRNEVVEHGKLLEEIISRLWSWFEFQEQRGRRGEFAEWRENPRKLIEC